MTSTPAVHVWQPVSATAEIVCPSKIPIRLPRHFFPNRSCAECIIVPSTSTLGGGAGFVGTNKSPFQIKCCCPFILWLGNDNAYALSAHLTLRHFSFFFCTTRCLRRNSLRLAFFVTPRAFSGGEAENPARVCDGIVPRSVPRGTAWQRSMM